jgi:hypothetical protein
MYWSTRSAANDRRARSVLVMVPISVRPGARCRQALRECLTPRITTTIMIPPDVRRLRELQRASGKRDLTSAESREHDRLYDARRLQIARMIQRPTCCAAAKKYPVVTFEVADVEGKRPTRGSWVAHMSERLGTILRGRDGAAWWDEMPDAKFCPFCGTALPVMVRKEPAPKTVSLVLDGGYYCSNCRERLDACLCDPPSFAFEPKE